MDTDDAGPGERGRLAPEARDELEWPFCGDEYPPLKGSPGALVCTKPQHPVTEIHLNEETGWVWRSGEEAWLPRRAGRHGGPRLVRRLEAGTCAQAAPRRIARTPADSHQRSSPFTGEPTASPGPVLAVKIDNLAPARPQTGLTDADIIYVLAVEGGLSRLLAVFSSLFPPVIGPVRSAREDDLELLAQFGRPAFAYGAQPHLLPVVEKASIIDLYAGRADGYFQGDLSSLLERHPGDQAWPSLIKRIGLTELLIT